MTYQAAKHFWHYHYWSKEQRQMRKEAKAAEKRREERQRKEEVRKGALLASALLRGLGKLAGDIESEIEQIESGKFPARPYGGRPPFALLVHGHDGVIGVLELTSTQLALLERMGCGGLNQLNMMDWWIEVKGVKQDGQ